MAFLRKQTKKILLLLDEGFERNLSGNPKVQDIIDQIKGALDYDQETVKVFLDRILEEVDKQEKEIKREKELARQEKEKQWK